MSAGATSARQAALKILLEDVDPLMQKTEDLSQLLTQVQAKLHTDLQQLDQAMQRHADNQQALNLSIRKLADLLKDVQALAVSMPPGAHGAAPARRPAYWLPCIVSGLLAAVLVASGLSVAGRDLIEQARVGRALQNAWPALDAGTRDKVERILSK